MIQLTIGSNTKKNTIVVQPTDTLQSAIDQVELDITGAALHLNGQMIPGASTGETFEELGVKDGSKAMLISVIKADSAK